MQKEGISLFLLKLFSSQCRKISWGESFKVSELCGQGKTLCRRGYRYSLLNFFSHSAKKFREVNHSKFQKNSGLKNFSAEEGDITILCWNIFFPQCQKIS